jgi:hypothetical protein
MEHGHHIDSRNIGYFRHVHDGEHADLRHGLHAGLVRNLRKVGVLSDRVAPGLQAFGISLAAA